MKQTAVEWYGLQIGILISKFFNNEISKSEVHFKRIEIEEQAKEIEKQQQGYSDEEVKQAYTEGSFAQLRYIDGLPYIDRDIWFEQFKNK